MRKIIPNNIIWFGIFISIITILTNLIFFAVTKALGEQYPIPLTETANATSPLSVAMIIQATLISVLLATGLFSLLTRIAPNAVLPPFLSITITAFIVSFGGPMELPNTLIKTKILLSVMHIITAVIIIGGYYIFHEKIRFKHKTNN